MSTNSNGFLSPDAVARLSGSYGIPDRPSRAIPDDFVDYDSPKGKEKSVTARLEDSVFVAMSKLCEVGKRHQGMPTTPSGIARNAIKMYIRELIRSGILSQSGTSDTDLHQIEIIRAMSLQWELAKKAGYRRQQRQQLDETLNQLRESLADCMGRLEYDSAYETWVDWLDTFAEFDRASPHAGRYIRERLNGDAAFINIVSRLQLQGFAVSLPRP